MLRPLSGIQWEIRTRHNGELSLKMSADFPQKGVADSVVWNTRLFLFRAVVFRFDDPIRLHDDMFEGICTARTK